MSPLPEPVVHPGAFVARSAVIRGRVEIHEGAVIMFGAVLRAEHDRIVVGVDTNIQDNAVVHCDAGYPALIGDSVTVGHAAVVHGATVGDHCLVGIGAMALNGSQLGEGAWLAAGAVLAEGREIPTWTLAVGIPAKPLRELTEAEVARQKSGVANYRDLGRKYHLAGDGTEGA